MSKNFQDVRKQTKPLERAGQAEGIAKGKVPKACIIKKFYWNWFFFALKGKMVMCTKALSPSLWSLIYVCQIGEEQYLEQFLLLRVSSICIIWTYVLWF